MYIAPNSVIKILKDVPLDPTFDHTIFFNDKTAQEAYFNTKVKYTFNNQMYQRLQRGYMRIETPAENLYDCNYVMYQNTAFGQRWFYAFITKVEYINNAVAEVQFMIDPMQTWFFDYQLQQCFVEREHSATDIVGDNLLAEPVPLGEYLTDQYAPQEGGRVNRLDSVKICVACSFGVEENIYEGVRVFTLTGAGGGMYDGIFSGTDYVLFDNTIHGAQEMRDFFEQVALNLKSEGIIDVFYVPSYFVTGRNSGDSAPDFVHQVPKRVTGSIDGYTPKNKKLYTYPYNFLYVTNYRDSVIYQYEFFNTHLPNVIDDGYCGFEVRGEFTANPCVTLQPNFYKGHASYWDESFILKGYPHCTFNTDVFKAWLAQTTVDLIGTGIGTLIAGMFSPSAAALVGGTGVANALSDDTWRYSAQQRYQEQQEYETVVPNNRVYYQDIRTNVLSREIGNVISDGITHYLAPAQMGGRNSGDATLIKYHEQNFHFFNKHITAEYAKIIDDYFSTFGYATNRLKVPNRNVRPHWCYTKTVGCVITGSIPADDAKAICAIYDRGITFWKNGNEVGNYSLNNSV